MSRGEVRITVPLDRVLSRHAGPSIGRAIRSSIDDELQRTAPYRSGRLRRSCFATFDPAAMELEVGATAPHAAAVEFGHRIHGTRRRVPARHFIRDAISKYTRGRGLPS